MEELKNSVKLIIWTDSYGHTSRWESLTSFDPEEQRILTFGTVVYEDKDIISLAGSYAPETNETVEQANGIMTIPKCCIKKTISFSSALSYLEAE